MSKNEENLNIPEVFKDVAPIPQDDGPHPVCSIAYSPEFTESMDYLRALLRLDERSERALRLTAVCLRHNPANYTTWHFRRRCLATVSKESGGYDWDLVEKDLAFTSELGGSNPKNYQIWYHRRALLEPFLNKEDGSTAEETLTKAKNELNYIASILSEDAKNYHAWSQRQWILRTLSDDELWNEEIQYAHSLILDDHRNNSAWNQRWFASHKGTKTPHSMENAKVEADYALNSAAVDPYNESPWRYFIGVLDEQQDLLSKDDTSSEFQSLIQKYEQQIINLRNSLQETAGADDANVCFTMTAAYIDLLDKKGSFSLAADLAYDLATKYDLIRKNYWLLREGELRSNA